VESEWGDERKRKRKRQTRYEDDMEGQKAKRYTDTALGFPSLISMRV